MQRIRYTLTLVVVALSALAVGQNAGTAPNQGAGQAGNSAAAAQVLHILTPKPGEKLRQNFVTIQLELTNAAASASGIPNFQLRLDTRDPVNTNSTEYTFTGLTPGAHTVEAQLADANNTPVAGAQSTVEFVVTPPGPTSQTRVREPIKAALRVDSQNSNAADESQELPSAGGALPLLSVIGFGVLLGGIASAMKTR